MIRILVLWELSRVPLSRMKLFKTIHRIYLMILTLQILLTEQCLCPRLTHNLPGVMSTYMCIQDACLRIRPHFLLIQFLQRPMGTVIMISSQPKSEYFGSPAQALSTHEVSIEDSFQIVSQSFWKIQAFKAQTTPLSRCQTPNPETINTRLFHSSYALGAINQELWVS
jgi:hypothetical protein